jgi:putative cell wall-binding protein
LTIRNTRVTKRLIAAVATAALGATLLALPASPVGATQTVTEDRVFGADRYATAANAALATFPASSSANIILASGEKFPDGMVAAGLAGTLVAPILLTREGALPTETINAMANITAGFAARTVHIVGGDGVVSAAVRAEITALGYTINELEGINRYETSAAVAEYSASLSPAGIFAGKRTAFLATGTGFADALSAGSPAYAGKHPILLTLPDALSTETSDAIDAIGVSQIIIMGGTGAVSQAVEDAVTAKGLTVIRIPGADRYETAKNLADVLIAQPANAFDFYGGGDPDATNKEVVLVSGVEFADALGAAPHAGTIGAPMLLVRPCEIPEPTAEFHIENNDVIDLVRVIGGPGAICEAVLDGAVAAATLTTPTAVITAEQGRGSFTIEFSEEVTISTVNAGDFTFSSVGRTLAASNVTALNAATATPNQATQFSVAIEDAPASPATFKSGDVVNLTISVVATPDVRLAGAATATVAPDTVRPTVTIENASPTATSFYVTFSEPVDLATLTAANITLNTVAVAGPIALVAGTTSTYSVGTTALVAGDVIVVTGALGTPNTGVLDLAGNAVVQKQKIVAVDTIAPVLQTAALTVVQAAAATEDSTEITFTGRANTATDGALGNGWVVDLVAGTDGAATTIVVNSATQIIKVTYDDAGANGLSVTGFILAWNASAANDLFSVDVKVAGPLLTVGTVTLVGGSTTATIAAQFSEAVQGIAGGDFTLAASSSVFATTTTPFTATPATAFDGKVSLTMTTSVATQVPVAGTSEVRIAASAITDLATNPIANTAVSITAAS